MRTSQPGDMATEPALDCPNVGKSAFHTPFSYLVMLNVAPENWCAKIEERAKVLGRSPQAEIRFQSEHRNMSRRHAEIWWDRQVVWLKDLESAFGTRVNGVLLKPSQPHRVYPGDRLWLGRIELKLIASVSPLAEIVAELNLHNLEAANGEKTGIALQSDRSFYLAKLGQLTRAELDVLLWLCRGYTEDQEIAKALCRSANTVRTHVARILTKFGAHTRAELIGLVRREELKTEHKTDHV